MIDTHCHLTDPRLASQIDAVLTRAASAGVKRVITIGTDLPDAHRALALCGERPNVSCAIGIHPNHVQADSMDHLPELRQLCGRGVAALGEMGLDYFHHFTDRALQARVFEAQLQMARELSLPVVIHSREAVDDTLAILKNHPGIRAVFHCFTGTLGESERILAAGHWISFTGPVTYKKNDGLREVVRRIPSDRLMVETDAPYLSPEPVRSSKICEPAFVMHTARVIAQVRGVSLEELDEQTTSNAERFFSATG